MPTDKLPDSIQADHDLRQRVKGFLHQWGYVLHRILKISVEEGVVLVRGQLPTFYLRQIAVECIKRVAGVTQVVDLIQVVNGPVPPQATDSPVDEPESVTVSTPHRAEVRDVVKTPQYATHTHVQNRHVLSSAMG